MAGRSLTASEQGIELAKQAIIAKGLDQKMIRARILCSRQPVSKFFNGKPVSRQIFVDICNILGVDWQEVAGLKQEVSPVQEVPQPEIDIDVLAEEVREKVRSDIQQRCGTMKVLDMTQPIGLGEIYTDVNILETITARQRLGLLELREICSLDVDKFDRFGLGKREKRVSGLEVVENYQKLMVWGKPGAGKTTFLKYLALQCFQNKSEKKQKESIFTNQIPIFIRHLQNINLW